MPAKKKVVEEKPVEAKKAVAVVSDAETTPKRRRRSRGAKRNKNSPVSISGLNTSVSSSGDAPIYVPINVMDLLGNGQDSEDDVSSEGDSGERVEFFSQEVAAGGEKAKAPLAVLDYGSVAITTATVTDKSGRTEVWMDMIDEREDAPVFEVDDDTTEPPEAPRRKVLLCVLESGKVDQCHLDLIIPTDLDAFFYHTGKGTVYLTGASRLMDWDELLYHSDSDSQEGSDDDLEFSSDDEELTDKSAIVEKIRKIAQLRKDAKEQGVSISDDDSSDSEGDDSIDSESEASSDDAGSQQALTAAFAKTAAADAKKAAPKADKAKAAPKAAPKADKAAKPAPKAAPKADKPAPKADKAGAAKSDKAAAPKAEKAASPKSASAGDNKASPKSAKAGENKPSPKSAPQEHKASPKSATAGDNKPSPKSAAQEHKASPKSAGDKKAVVTAFGAAAPKGKPAVADKAKGGKRASDSPAEGERPNKKQKGDAKADAKVAKKK